MRNNLGTLGKHLVLTATLLLILPSAAVLAQSSNSVSVEEYNRLREKSTGLQWKNIITDLIIVTAVIGGIVTFVVVRKRKKKAVSSLSIAGTPVAPQQMPAAPMQPTESMPTPDTPVTTPAQDPTIASAPAPQPPVQPQADPSSEPTTENTPPTNTPQ